MRAMSGKSKEVGVRLAVQGDEAVKRAFVMVGREGKEAMRQIEYAAKPASTALMTVNAAVSASKSVLVGWGTGVLGGVAAAVSLSAAINAVKQSLDDMGEIADRSK